MEKDIVMKGLSSCIVSFIAISCFSHAYAAKQEFFIADAPPLAISHSNAKSNVNLNLLQHVKNQTLDLSGSGLEDKNMPAIVDFLKKNPQITIVNLGYNGKLTGVGLVPLASITSLKELNLERNYKDCPNNKCIGGLEAKDVALFANHKSLTKLNLMMHSVGDGGAEQLAQSNSITDLELSGNDLTDKGGVALAGNKNLKYLALNFNEVGLLTAQAIAKNTTLEHLSLNQTAMDDQAISVIAQNKTLQKLSLGLTYLHDQGAIALAGNTTLKKLIIWETHIELAGIQALAKNKTLQKLDYSRDTWPTHEKTKPIGDIGAQGFTDNANLTYLGLGTSDISVAGVKALVKNKNLRHLVLYENPKIGDNGALLITQDAPQLTELNLAYCKISDNSIPAIANLTNLKELWIVDNVVSDKSAVAIASHPTLNTVGLLFNEIHDEGAIALAQINRPYKVLWAGYNRMTIIGNEALSHNKYFYDLWVGGTNYHDGAKSSMQALRHYVAVSKHSVYYRTGEALHCINNHSDKTFNQ